MLHGVFKIKGRSIVIATMGVVIIIMVIILSSRKVDNKKFLEQAVMAENYLETGHYEEAIEAYTTALSMNDQDHEILTIGLAEAYAGIHDYDNALEVLRSCYQKTSGYLVKEKIEEIISEKTDYEYSQSISRAEIYFNNKDYEKAIDVFEEAKQIKSKDAIAYERIAEAYIEMGEYEKAKEELLEGQAITKDSSLEQILEEVETYLKQDEYNLILKQASEYIYQENYKDGVAKYQEAIKLLPGVSEAYIQLAQFYIDQKYYEQAIDFLQEAVSQIESKELQSLLKQAKEYQRLEKEKNKLLLALYGAFGKMDVSEIKNIMSQEIFQKELVKGKQVVYPVEANDYIMDTFLVIYDANTVYYGNMISSIRQGVGIYFMLTDGGSYYYQGEWKEDVPNGLGKTVEETETSDSNGEIIVNKTITDGYYSDGKENGRMEKSFFVNEEETGRVSYIASKGVPKPMGINNSLLRPASSASGYIIGILETPEDAQEDNNYFRVDAGTVWGVKPFLSK